MARNIRLPTWAQYMLLSDDDREHLYQRWCLQQALNPEADGVGYLFVEAIPLTVHEQDEQELEISEDDTEIQQ